MIMRADAVISIRNTSKSERDRYKQTESVFTKKLKKYMQKEVYVTFTPGEILVYIDTYRNLLMYLAGVTCAYLHIRVKFTLMYSLPTYIKVTQE